MKKSKEVRKAIHEMITENTGSAICDLGGYNGRNWQRNQGKTIKDFDAMPAVKWEFNDYDKTIDYTVNIWHYLTLCADYAPNLQIDAICRKFNKLNATAANWDFDGAYGVSAEAGKYLESVGIIGNAWNTYNGENTLSQVLQGAEITIDDERYVLLQIHGGADVRGGYTNARLFKYLDDECYINACPDVYGRIDGVEVSSSYYGYKLSDDSGHDVENVTKDSLVELYI